MAGKLKLDDLKVQSFVTTLTAEEAGQLVGGSGYDGSVDCCSQIGPACSGTRHSWCCESGTYAGCGDPTVYAVDCSYGTVPGNTDCGDCPTQYTDPGCSTCT